MPIRGLRSGVRTVAFRRVRVWRRVRGRARRRMRAEECEGEGDDSQDVHGNVPSHAHHRVQRDGTEVDDGSPGGACPSLASRAGWAGARMALNK